MAKPYIICIASIVATAALAQPHNVPLNDLGTGTYRGYIGGLYPNGSNMMPPAHAAAALQFANQVVPRDAAGNPNPSGKIVLLTIGMSNTTQESSPFERQEDTNTARNARVILINGAVGGQTASIIRNPNAGYWQIVMDRLTSMGVTAAQVQAVWLKEANANPPNDFPGHALQLKDDLTAVVQVLHDKFPNLHLCYCSSRVYGGYATTTLNPEPQAYESGFSYQWLIGDQINGSPDLNYDPARGTVRAPLLLWAAYLWADGTHPRSDGLIWLPQDFESDGTHPSTSGEQKVADLLSTFFASDAITQTWYARRTDASLFLLNANADAYVRSDAPMTNFGADTRLLTAGGATTITTYLRFDLSRVLRPLIGAKLSLRVASGTSGITVRAVADNNWSENSITYQNAPSLGQNLIAGPSSSRESTVSFDVTSSVNYAGSMLTLALTSTQAEGSLLSKESGQPPRLIITVGDPQDIAPTAMTVSPGLILSGDLTSLVSSDDSYLTLRPGIVLNSSQRPIALMVSTVAPSSNVGSLQFTVESRSQQSGIVQRIEAFNFVTGNYDLLNQSTLSVTGTDTVITSFIPNPANYIGPANQMRGRITYKTQSPAVTYPWLIYEDQVKWRFVNN